MNKLLPLLCLITIHALVADCGDESKPQYTYPPGDIGEKYSSPKGTFMLETYGIGPGHHWIVQRSGKKVEAVLLRVPEDRSTLYPFQFDISPGEEWLLLDQKQYHGSNRFWLYHRDRPLSYSLVFPCFSDAAWKYFEKSTGEKWAQRPDFIIRHGRWPAKGSSLMRFTLWSGDAKRALVDWAFHFDLATRKFLPSKDQATRYVNDEHFLEPR